MVTQSLISGIFLLIMATGLKFYVVLLRYPGKKERISRFLAIPPNAVNKDEWFLVMLQLMAWLWIIIGIICKATSLESRLKEIPYGNIIELMILYIPIIILILILIPFRKK